MKTDEIKHALETTKRIIHLLDDCKAEQIKDVIRRSMAIYCIGKSYKMDQKDENPMVDLLFDCIKTNYCALALGEIPLIFRYALHGSLQASDKYMFTVDAFTVPAKEYYTHHVRTDITRNIKIVNALPDPNNKELTQEEIDAKNIAYCRDLYKQMYNAYWYNKPADEIAKYETGSYVFSNLERVGKIKLTTDHFIQASQNLELKFKQTRDPSLKEATKIAKEILEKGIEQIKTTFLQKEAERLCLKEYFEELIKKDKAKASK